MSEEPIDFDDIKWGSLTKQLKAFNRKNKTKMDLESFSKHILDNPKKFIERSKDRARFYLNVIKPKAKKGGALSSHVMSDLLAQSYKTKNKKERKTEVDGFHIDPSLSGERVQVWYNPTTKQAVVVHRGTQGLNDWMTDARMFFGDTKNKRFKHAKNIQQQAEEKYGASHVSTIGHSLGSRISEEVGQKSKEVLTLNKPTTLADIVRNKKVSEKQIDVRTKNDPVSILRPFQGGNETIEIDSTTNNPLTEHGTETLKRLDPDVMIGRGSLGGIMRGRGAGTSIPVASSRVAPDENERYEMNTILQAILDGGSENNFNRERIMRTFTEIDAPTFFRNGGYSTFLEVSQNQPIATIQQIIREMGTPAEADMEEIPMSPSVERRTTPPSILDSIMLPSAEEQFHTDASIRRPLYVNQVADALANISDSDSGMSYDTDSDASGLSYDDDITRPVTRRGGKAEPPRKPAYGDGGEEKKEAEEDSDDDDDDDAETETILALENALDGAVHYQQSLRNMYDRLPMGNAERETIRNRMENMVTSVQNTLQTLPDFMNADDYHNHLVEITSLVPQEPEGGKAPAPQERQPTPPPRPRDTALEDAEEEMDGLLQYAVTLYNASYAEQDPTRRVPLRNQMQETLDDAEQYMTSLSPDLRQMPSLQQMLREIRAFHQHFRQD